MKKFLSILLILALIGAAAALSACSDNAGSGSAVETADETITDTAEEEAFNYLLLVNKLKELPDNYEGIVDLIDVENSLGDKFTIERKTYLAFNELRDDLLENDGIQIELDSVYRSVKEQQEIVDEFTEEYGEDYVKKYVAVPGYSEHHTGLAVDIGLFVGDEFVNDNDQMIAQTELFSAIHQKLADHGFILRYLDGHESITGYAYEPWHFRYIDDPDIAHKIMDNDITLEEFLDEVPDQDMSPAE